MSIDRNCLSYWFPLISQAGLPVPWTSIVAAPGLDLAPLLDGRLPDGPMYTSFMFTLAQFVEKVGTPCFLRTGHVSGKHRWSQTCHLRSVRDLPSHVAALVEWSHLADVMGLPTEVWAVREMLPTTPVMAMPRYEGFPVCREFRFFVRDGKVRCSHGYWPKQALLDGLPMRRPAGKGGLEAALSFDRGDPNCYELPPDFDGIYQRLLEATPAEYDEMHALAERAGRAVGGGYWSVDLLETKRGWHVTDMAEGERSFHWQGCKEAGR